MGYWSRLAPADITVDGTDDRRIWKSGADALGFRIGQCVDAEHELTGKAYFEVEAVNVNGTPGTYNASVGVAHDTHSLTAYVGASGAGNGWGLHSSGNVWAVGTVAGAVFSYTTGDIVMIAIDVDAGKVWYGVNGIWVGDPAVGTSPQVEDATIYSDSVYMSGGAYAEHAGLYLRAAADEQTYTPPTGYSAVVSGAPAETRELAGTLPLINGRFGSGDAQFDGHWPLDKVEGDVTRDIKYTNDATVSNMTVDAGGVLNACLAGGYVGGATARNITFGSPVTQLESFAFRFKADSNDNVVFEGNVSSGLGCYLRCYQTGQLSFHVNPSTNINIGSTLTLDAWHHVCFVKEGTTNSRVYIDGVSVGTIAYQLLQVNCMGYPTTFTSYYVPSIDDIRCSLDRWSGDQVSDLSSMTVPDYSDNRLEGTLLPLTGSFTGQVTGVEAEAGLSGVLPEVTGDFYATNRVTTLNGALPEIHGYFVPGKSLHGELQPVTGLFTGKPGVSGIIDGDLLPVTGYFSTGPLLNAVLKAVTGDFTATVEHLGSIDGTIKAVTGSFLGRVEAVATLDGALPRISFSGKATVHPLATIDSSLSPIIGSFDVLTGATGELSGSIRKIKGNLSGYTINVGDYQIMGTLPVMEGEFSIINEFDHGIMQNVRGAVR